MERLNLSIEHGETQPIYLLGEAPFWFVPNKAAHKLLSLWLEGAERGELVEIWRQISGKPRTVSDLDVEKLFASIKPPPYSPYKGRKSLDIERLTEVWFHLTEACNLACKHCLFGGTQSRGLSLDPEKISSTIKETYELGARLFCFTGGEPLMHPAFLRLLEKALTYEDTRVVTLTNGILLQGMISGLKKLDYRRMHFQVSIDGLEDIHDQLRGKGTFSKSADALGFLLDSRIPCSIAMAVNEQNVHEMSRVVELAYRIGVRTVHYLWHFKRGKGKRMEIVPMDTLIPRFKEAIEKSRETGVLIDNVEAIRAQVFTPACTRFDFGNGGWESLAVGPDGSIYPTPAMVGMEKLCGGNIRDGIEKVWKESEILDRVRFLSLVDTPKTKNDPWRFILGGGDIDHCIMNGTGTAAKLAISDDPYVPLYKFVAKEIILEESRKLPEPSGPGLILRMGDIVHECPATADINFTHCNCLLSVGEEDIRGLVRRFYKKRSEKTDKTIANPVNTGDELSQTIPKEALLRSYGCGSPVEDAELKPGYTVVDLGSGTGIECLIASKKVGKSGRVIGIDMTEEMLKLAEKAKKETEKTLGFSNTSFIKGFLESIPLRDNFADVVISNCVINLTRNKRRVFKEIARILKPGGRLVISDVVTEEEPPLSIRADQKLTGECIGGAMVQGYLFSVLEDMGFKGARIIKRFPYRVVQGHRFYSLTFSAAWPGSEKKSASVLYGGPFRAVVMEDGTVLRKGVVTTVSLGAELDVDRMGEEGLFLLDQENGAVTNVHAESKCACYIPAEAKDADIIPAEVPETGCLLCGEPLTYLSVPIKKICARCGNTEEANAVCKKGHFVCDLCHIQDPIEVIKTACLATREKDMVRLLQNIRSHQKIPMHGPEHHALVPGIILSTYRNLGGKISDREILTGIDRGTQIPGGSCAFMGTCGAAAGVGIAFSIILNSNPLTSKERQVVQRVVSKIIGKISEQEAARCCQRECYVALTEAAKYSHELFPFGLQASHPMVCEQYRKNRECIKTFCGLYPDASCKVTGITKEKAGNTVVTLHNAAGSFLGK